MPRVPELLVITDRHAAMRAGHCLAEVVERALEGGAPAVLFRDKDLSADDRRALGEQLAPLVRAAGSLLLVSSDPALADHLDADGVHLAAGDPAPTEDDRDRGAVPGLLGRSCHGAGELATALEEGVDYATVSPVAASASKPGYGPVLGVTGVSSLCSAAGRLPLLALGGVTPTNIGVFRRAGAAGAAVMGGIMGARDPAEQVRSLLAAWHAAGPASAASASPADSTTESR